MAKKDGVTWPVPRFNVVGDGVSEEYSDHVVRDNLTGLVWARDANLRLIGGAAGGSVWLPDDVRITGLDDRRGIRFDEDPEVPRPTLNLSISETMGRFVVMD